ncbi:hypothetical protein [Streptomyces werraensis]|uniref:hypothetical protein n=1 Tax=Streptomyces werraensis TaxID=68284 RepID=UPI001CE37BDA
MTAAVYVATHPDLAAHRIGLTDAYADTDRLRVNERRGWRMVGVVHLPTRTEAEHVEAAVLAELRRAGVEHGVVPGAMPHGGHTETIPASAMSAVELLRLVRRRAGQPEDGPADGRLGAALELLAWARRHVGPAAVDTAWEGDRERTDALLRQIAAEAEDLADAARAEADVPEGARALRVLERMVQRLREVDARLEELEQTMPASFWKRPEVRAMCAQLAEASEAIASRATEQLATCGQGAEPGARDGAGVGA